MLQPGGYHGRIAQWLIDHGPKAKPKTNDGENEQRGQPQDCPPPSELLPETRGRDRRQRTIGPLDQLEQRADGREALAQLSKLSVRKRSR